MEFAYRAFLEAIILVETRGFAIYGVNQYGARTNLLRSSQTSLKRVLKQSRANAALLLGIYQRRVAPGE